MEIMIVDIFSVSLGTFAVLTLYNTFWVRKKEKRIFFVSAVFLLAIVNIATANLVSNYYLQFIINMAFLFILSLCYYASTAYRILLSLAYLAVLLVTEAVTGIAFVQILSIPFELFTVNTQVYMFGVLTSNLLTIFFVLMIRVFMRISKHESERPFNILIAFMPIQSIILCYMTIDYSLGTETPNNTPIGIVAIALSIALIFITMFILYKQQKAMMYKREYELNKTRLDMQIEHYREIYQEQQRIKSMRHDMNNKLVALMGTLNAGNVKEAVEKINIMSSNLLIGSNIVDTGNPPIDAILSVKATKAIEEGIALSHTVLIDGELYIDQFDIAIIIANALDNAIEGVLRSTNVDKAITLNISRVADYISIIIENSASGPILTDFKTSKPDKKNHGYGMAQMKDVVQKYNGSFRPIYNEETKMFSLKIMLKNQQG
jgi:anti-sigma regulatory factor (Ser/Thr protein kinase)